MKNKLLLILSVIILCYACKNDVAMKEVNLMSYGMPIAIKVPDQTTITKDSTQTLISEVKIDGGEQFNMVVTKETATTTDYANLKANALELAKLDETFKEIVSEDDQGFIFEKTRADGVTYDFRYIKLQGDNQYSFEGGYLGKFSLEDVKRMYSAVSNN